MAMPCVPVLQRACLREQCRLPRRPFRRSAAQVDSLRRDHGKRRRFREEPGLLIAQAEEVEAVRHMAHVGAVQHEQLALGVGQRASLGIEDDDACIRPQRVQRGGIRAQVVGAIERAINEGERSRAHAHTVNDEPQPQVVFAFGLRITKCAPISDSV